MKSMARLCTRARARTHARLWPNQADVAARSEQQRGKLQGLVRDTLAKTKAANAKAALSKAKAAVKKAKKEEKAVKKAEVMTQAPEDEVVPHACIKSHAWHLRSVLAHAHSALAQVSADKCAYMPVCMLHLH